MNADKRIDGWLNDLDRLLDQTESLVRRGRDSYDTDQALPLAFEALCNRVGDLAKKLTTADEVTFADTRWSQTARTRDFVVHQYHRVDSDVLWETVHTSIPKLRPLIAEIRHHRRGAVS